MGREDDLDRTSDTPFLDNRASGGLRVISVLFLYLKDASDPRDSRTVGALEADPEGRGGVGRSCAPGRVREVPSA
jgi:hypothetical protein